MKPFLFSCLFLPAILIHTACAHSRPNENNEPPQRRVKLQLVTDGFISPVNMAVPGDGSERLFFCQKEGKVWIVKQNRLLPTPFLDVSADLVNINPGYDERGLLGMAFHPEFIRNRKFYVYYSAKKAKPGFDHTSRILEFTASASNPDVADQASGRVVMEIDEPESNHNGGQLQFGPDGYLYVGLGDGGGGGDKHGAAGNGQNLGTLLGKILRINVNGTPYTIPPDNPFVNRPGARPEIWAYGLRNPWRFSFDRQSRMLFAGDVGQNRYEEVDIITRGGNYGWRIMEGNHEYNVPPGADRSTLIAPIDEYSHDVGISVTGGYVYRGKAIPALQGAYVFGDYNGKAFVLTVSGRKWERADLELLGRPKEGIQILSWGEDENGELYMLTSSSGSNGFKGAIYKLVKE
ncbi:PQQ-dependent sugar dehydrogenase [Chitinophaga sp. 212800010-3]|uniref:PQQ-dependent sugar dehydrogenase n=1 Tax=unclassified Chitinophaga TaxID=2619133 RepID=UPI002DF6559E|nr:Soluble aldose sugar dehydrogenase YliI [Chitinophaga sp. 212800010-3]